MPVRNPIHFLAMHLRVPSPQLFVLLLDSPLQPPCSAGLIGFIGIPSTITALGFFFLGMRFLRHGALDARSRCRRTIYFAGGVDSFGFFGAFFVRLPRGRNCTNGGFPSSLRSRSTPRIKRQISSLVSGSSESQTLNSSLK
jgi:hypothetical protein